MSFPASLPACYYSFRPTPSAGPTVEVAAAPLQLIPLPPHRTGRVLLQGGAQVPLVEATHRQRRQSVGPADGLGSTIVRMGVRIRPRSRGAELGPGVGRRVVDSSKSYAGWVRVVSEYGGPRVHLNVEFLKTQVCGCTLNCPLHASSIGRIGCYQWSLDSSVSTAGVGPLPSRERA